MAAVIPPVPASSGSALARLVRPLAGGVAAGLLLLGLELLLLRALGSGPTGADLAKIVRTVGPLQAAVGLATGLVALFLGGRRRANAWVFLGLPLFLVAAFTLAVHAEKAWFDGKPLLSAGPLALAGGALFVGALGALFLSRRAAAAGAGGWLGPELPLLVLCSLLLAAAATLARPSASSTEGPNVVLVVLDTTRLDRLSAYGYERATTPTLERLAREGTRFERCYAAAPWTVPSHAAIFTGEHTSTHGATRQRPILDGRLPTLAERMHARGYRTVSFSKKSWLSAETGLLRGFSEIIDLHNPPTLPAMLSVRARLQGAEQSGDKGGTEITRMAAEWLQERGEAGPFFAFFNYNEAHSDLRPPREYRQRFLSEEHFKSPWGRSEYPDNHGFSVGTVAYGPEDLQVFSDLYDAEIAYQDALLGRLVDAFEEAGVLDDSLFLVTADHGENLGEHGLLGHEMSLHETLLRVPLVARLPGRLPAGASVSEPVENRLLGTLIERVVSSAEPLDVERLRADLTDPRFEGIVSEEYQPSFQTPKWDFTLDERFNCMRKSLLDGTHKLLWRSNAEQPALFDVVSDPGEENDLAGADGESAKALLERLLERADLWRDLGGSEVEFSAGMQQRLQQMGYF